jgi:hypothetical protein
VSLAASRTSGLIHSGHGQLDALNGGYHIAFLVGALFAVIAACLGAALLRSKSAVEAHAAGAEGAPKPVLADAA